MDSLLVTILVLWLVGYIAYRGVLLIFRPEIILEEKRQRHEIEMAKRQRNLGLMNLLARVFFGR